MQQLFINRTEIQHFVKTRIQKKTSLRTNVPDLWIVSDFFILAIKIYKIKENPHY